MPLIIENDIFGLINLVQFVNHAVMKVTLMPRSPTVDMSAESDVLYTADDKSDQ
jgi:hypothetical protein